DDRNEFGCSNPGQCVETAKIMIDCIHPKWNPLVDNKDLCEGLQLSAVEQSANDHGGDEGDARLTFDPEFRLSDLSHGFRIFALEDHATQLSTKRFSIPD
ncbi:hypothetical protein B0H16DRAFT_1226303, partial [Mycena metata]